MSVVGFGPDKQCNFIFKQTLSFILIESIKWGFFNEFSHSERKTIHKHFRRVNAKSGLCLQVK